MAKKFSKQVEDFTCDYCSRKVEGTGYTDHCPECLWSKHVDINPGDRDETCQGMMKPIAAERRGDNWRILYRCQKCGYKQFNRAASNDNIDKIIELSKVPISLSNKNLP